MFNWEPVSPRLRDLRDRLSTSTVGYSFVSDPANNLQCEYLELFKRACQSPLDSLVTKDSSGQSIWNMQGVQAYLSGHNELLKTLLLLLQLAGGKGIRISELLTLEYCNTPSRLRGICLYGAKLCSITRHHKARLTTNNEFQVARFYPNSVTNIVY